MTSPLIPLASNDLFGCAIGKEGYFFLLGRRPPRAAAATLLTFGEVRLLRSNLLALRATLSDVLGFTFFMALPRFKFKLSL
jgi:hypothetical protein